MARTLLDYNGFSDYKVSIILTKDNTVIRPPFRAIRDCVCEYYAVDSDVVFFKTRIQPFCMIRQVIFFISHVVYAYTVTELSSFTSYDHSTVTHSCKVVKTQMEVDNKYCEKVNDIIKILNEKFA